MCDAMILKDCNLQDKIGVILELHALHHGVLSIRAAQYLVLFMCASVEI